MDDEESGERRTLLNGGRKRKATSRSSKNAPPFAGAKRKRAATLKEVIDIWEELGDGEDEERYGTFEINGSSQHAGRPASAGHQARRTSRRRRGSNLEAANDHLDGGEGLDTSLDRASTMPNTRHHSRSERRRRSTHHESGALFSDMLKVDWWRTKRKSGDGSREAGAEDEHHGEGQ